MDVLPTPVTPEPRPLRTLLVLAGVGVVMALVFLLPRRESNSPVQLAAELPRVELDEPPAWAVQRGAEDEVLRALDRLEWGGPDALEASREALERHAGTLAPLVLPRLAALGPDRAVLASKLIELLGNEDLSTPGLLDALILRARSPSGLEAKAALRVLSESRDPRALDGILPRLMDADPEVRGFARAALAQVARHGNLAAQSVILGELESQVNDPDLAYLAVAAEFQDQPRVEAVLRQIERSPYEEPALVARTALLRLGDPEAERAFREMLAGTDPFARRNALNALVASGRVLGWESFESIVRTGGVEDILPIVSLAELAVDRGDPEAPVAMDLLEALAADRNNSVHGVVTDWLYARSHPWAVEATRVELRQFVGARLAEVVSRIIAGPAALQRELAESAAERLATQELRDQDRELLMRLLAHTAPDLGVEPIVREALDEQSPIAPLMLTLLSRLGPVALQRLERELGRPEADALFIRVALESRSSAALPGLERLLLAPDTDPALRRAALDCLGRLRDGPRAELLRKAVAAHADRELAAHARLVFWNYL
jgi:hypothetical protein